MTIRQLVNQLVKREGLKKQVEIAQVREIIGHLSDMIYEEYDKNHYIYLALLINGNKRSKRKKKK